MIIGSYTDVANPIEIQATPFSLVTGNLTATGVKMQKLLRCWGSTLSPAGQVIRCYRFRISWAGLSVSEYNRLMLAHQQAAFGYVRLNVKNLGVSFLSVSDQYYVIADPEAPQLLVSWQQGYVSGPDAGNPIVYDVQALYLGATAWNS